MLDPVQPDPDPVASESASGVPDLDAAIPDPDLVSAGAGSGRCRIQGSPWTLALV